MRKVWTIKEEELLAEKFQTATWEDMLVLFGTTKKKIWDKAQKLGIKRRKPIDREALVKDYSEGLGINAICEKYEISNPSAYYILDKYAIPRHNNTITDDAAFIEDYKTMPMSALVEKYAVSRPTIHKKVKALGLVRDRYLLFKQPKISRDKVEQFKQAYLGDGKSIATLATEYAISAGAVHNMLAAHDVKLPREEVLKRTGHTNIARYGQPTPKYQFGKTEGELRSWVEEQTGKLFPTTRELLDGKEIDLYNAELKLGIEYCGLRWHNENSPQPRNADYHHGKYIGCAAQGIRLVTIFEDEWLYRNSQCKNFLKAVLASNKIRLYARKCEVKLIDKTLCKQFYDAHHIQGRNHLGLHYAGVYHQDELVGAMSFGRHHRNPKDLVLDRLCFKDDVSVLGGASKLFKFLVKHTGAEKILSWSDNRWSQGEVYRKLGFVLKNSLKADYSYVDPQDPTKRKSKQSQKKGNTNCPDGLTEKEWSLQNGLFRIWDCGKQCWEWTAAELPS